VYFVALVQKLALKLRSARIQEAEVDVSAHKQLIFSLLQLSRQYRVLPGDKIATAICPSAGRGA
jgi:hypothetical protein